MWPARLSRPSGSAHIARVPTTDRSSALAVTTGARVRAWRDRLRAALVATEIRKWVVTGVALGVLVGLACSLFLFAIDRVTAEALGRGAGLTPPLPAGEGSSAVHGATRPWLLPAIVAAGALVSGLLVHLVAPETEGGGTDAAIAAFHDAGGRVRRRVPPVKLLVSAIVLGTGGSAGREGPSAQIGAGLASWVSDALRLDERDRRIACAVGIGAGIGAIFKAPLGGAILSAELAYIRDFEIEAIVPGFIASVVAYSVVSSFHGFTPIFGEGLGLRFEHPSQLGWYALLGALAGVLVIVYARVFFAIRRAFHAARLPRWAKPAIGGLLVGVIALRFPQVLSIGYGWLQLAIDGNHAELATGTMLALVAVKIVATSLTVGSGGSGGDFAPVLYVGGMLGGGVWGILHGRVGGIPEAPESFVIVTMMALLAGAAKAPLAVIIMVTEMTGEFSMLVPAMVAAGIAYLVSGDTTLYDQQRRTRADSPAHRTEYARALVQAASVAEAMRRGVVTAAAGEPIADAVARMTRARVHALPVLSGERLVGIVTARDAARGGDGTRPVAEVMHAPVIVAYPDETLAAALERMAATAVSRLPVVDRAVPDRLVGVLSIRDIAAILGATPEAAPLVPAIAAE